MHHATQHQARPPEINIKTKFRESPLRVKVKCALVVGHREKKGLCCKKIIKMALLSSFDMPWRAEHKWLPISSHFKNISWVFF
jgi:hypothetical protein